MAVLSSLLLVFIILGMYNFGRAMKFRLLLVRMMSEWLMSIGQYFGMKFIKKGNLRRAIQKHEWMPRMLPTHSTLPPSATKKVILSLSYEEMTRKLYRGSPHLRSFHNHRFHYYIFWLMYMQVGDVCVSRPPTFPLTWILHNLFFLQVPKSVYGWDPW